MAGLGANEVPLLIVMADTIHKVGRVLEDGLEGIHGLPSTTSTPAGASLCRERRLLVLPSRRASGFGRRWRGFRIGSVMVWPVLSASMQRRLDSWCKR